MFFVSKLLLVCFIGVAIIYADDQYCAPDICPPGTEHVACGRDIEWNPRCSDNAEFIEFTPQLQQIILDAHNKLRNQQANGDTPGFEPAKRMATMTWDDELAEIAKYNTMKCKIEHDQCQSTQTFYLAGQNLAQTGDADIEWIVESRPSNWFKEYVYADMSEIRSHRSLKGARGKDIGHFTQIVKDDCYKMGCSIAKFSTNGDDNLKVLLACNYAVSNIKNWPIYEAGETASACQTGINPDFPALCSVEEIYHKPYFHNEDTRKK